MVERVDLAIIGGGIAAAAAVLSLRDSSRSIAIIAPPPSPQPRIGESLSRAATPILQDLGIWEAFLEDGHRPSHVTFSAWGTDQLIERNANFNPSASGWSLDRQRFEALLWRQAEAIPCLRRPTALKRFHSGPTARPGKAFPADSWHLELRDGEMLEARFVLDCSGRAAVVSRHLAKRCRHSQLVAAYSFLSQVELDVLPTPAVLIETTTEGWWYSSLTPQGQMVVVFFFDPNLLAAHSCRRSQAWEALLRSAPYTWKRITTAGFASAGLPTLTDASSQTLDRYTGETWAAAGDAAAALDPVSSHGLTMALWSGRQAALGADAALAGDPEPLRRYEERLIVGISRYREELRRLYTQEQRFPQASFWQQRWKNPG